MSDRPYSPPEFSTDQCAVLQEAIQTALAPLVGQIYTPMSVEAAKENLMKALQEMLPMLSKRLRVMADFDKDTNHLDLSFEEEDANGKAWSDYNNKQLYRSDGRAVYALYAMWGTDGYLELALVDYYTSARLPNVPASTVSFTRPA